MAAKPRTYTPEFKLQAVKMITDQQLSVAEVARLRQRMLRGPVNDG